MEEGESWDMEEGKSWDIRLTIIYKLFNMVIAIFFKG